MVLIVCVCITLLILPCEHYRDQTTSEYIYLDQTWHTLYQCCEVGFEGQGHNE